MHIRNFSLASFALPTISEALAVSRQLTADHLDHQVELYMETADQLRCAGDIHAAEHLDDIVRVLS